MAPARHPGDPVGVTEPLRDRMQSDLPAAMKARDATRVSVLRTTLAAVANAEAVHPADGAVAAGLLGDVARKDLSEDDVRSIVARERDDLATTAGEMEQLGQAEEAAELGGRAAILDGYLADYLAG